MTDRPENKDVGRAAAIQRLTEVSRQVSDRMAVDGIVTEDDKQAFIDSLASVDEVRKATTGSLRSALDKLPVPPETVGMTDDEIMEYADGMVQEVREQQRKQ